MHFLYRDVMENDAADRGRAFAKLIRDGRLDRGWTQDQLVAESGISKSTLVRWEGGRAERPDPDQVKAVCRTLGIDPRLAAVALGYLDPEDIEVPGEGRRLAPAVEEVIQILEDPRVPAGEKEQWVKYLLFLRDQARAHDGNGRRAG